MCVCVCPSAQVCGCVCIVYSFFTLCAKRRTHENKAQHPSRIQHPTSTSAPQIDFCSSDVIFRILICLLTFCHWSLSLPLDLALALALLFSALCCFFRFPLCLAFAVLSGRFPAVVIPCNWNEPYDKRAELRCSIYGYHPYRCG